jgi:UDP-N-acetylmuramyl pentapeptide phosphotransferase/UDP-N-acetylglucosamine-1-phosphate transferase
VIQTVIAAAAVAFGVGAAGAWLIARNASRLRLLDVPNDRSAHVVATPRGGGIGIVAGVAAGTVLLAVAGIPPGAFLAIALLGAAALAAVGAIDDFWSLSARYRLVAQFVVATVIVIKIGVFARFPLPAPFDATLGWVAWPLTIIWLMGVTNFYNFMDGIDGLAGGQAIASCIGVMLAAWSLDGVRFAAVLAAATFGFLLFNLPPARVFLGDVGSTSIGFAIATMPLLAPSNERSIAVLAVAIGLSLFLLDPVETLFRLLRAGHQLGVAHRLHSYQRLASANGTRLVAASIVLCGLALSVGGALSYRFPGVAWPVIAGALGAYAAERFAAGRAQFAPDPSAHE